MVDYDVYAVRKNYEGDITHCSVHSGILKDFSSEAEAKLYIKTNCTEKSKATVIYDIEYSSANPYTKVLKYTNGHYEFKLGAKIHVINHSYLRTDGNSTNHDNLDEILEID